MGLLEFAAGLPYLANKILFWLSERVGGDTKWKHKTNAWLVYMIGLPSWLILFGHEHNWIAAAVELGGSPSMVLGFLNARKRKEENPSLWLVGIAFICTIAGLVYSIHEFGGLTQFTQVLELGLAVGFLVGTFLLALDIPHGYFFFLLMNASNAVLMAEENRITLCVQQILSFGFVLLALRRRFSRS